MCVTATQTRRPPQKCSGHGAPLLADEEKTVEGFAQKLYCAVDDHITLLLDLLEKKDFYVRWLETHICPRSRRICRRHTP